MGSSATLANPFGQSAADAQYLAWHARQDVPVAARRKLALIRCPRCGSQTRECLLRKALSVALSIAPIFVAPLFLMLMAFHRDLYKVAMLPNAVPVAMAVGALFGIGIAVGEWKRWSRARYGVVFREDPAWGQYVQ